MATLRSRRFNYELGVGSIPAGSTYYNNLETVAETRDQVPFNNIIIRNFSGQRFRVEYNDTVAIIAGSEIYADDAAYGLRDIKITNLSDAANDDILFVTISRVVTSDAASIANITGENLFDVANGVV